MADSCHVVWPDRFYLDYLSDPDYFIQRMPISANKLSIILQDNIDSSKYPFSSLNSRKERSN